MDQKPQIPLLPDLSTPLAWCCTSYLLFDFLLSSNNHHLLLHLLPHLPPHLLHHLHLPLHLPLHLLHHILLHHILHHLLLHQLGSLLHDLRL